MSATVLPANTTDPAHAPDAPGASVTLTHPLARALRTPKTLLTVLFVPLLVVAATAHGWGAASSYFAHVATAIAGACIVDVLFARWRGRAWRLPDSAWLSGAIVAFVLGPETPAAVTLAIAALASLSKHVIVVRRAHVFNPAGLALLVSIPLFATGQSWWGALPDRPAPWLLLLLAAGAVVVDRVNKFPLALSFLATYFGLFTLAAASGMHTAPGVGELFRDPFLHAALFFALFMLTDPPTSPAKYVDQVWIGALVAAVSAAYPP